MNGSGEAGVPAPGRGPVIRSFAPRRDALSMTMLVFWTLFTAATVIMWWWVPGSTLLRVATTLFQVSIWFDLAGSLFWTRYGVTTDAVVIRQGPFRQVLRFGAIQEVRFARRRFPLPGRAMQGIRIVRRRPAGSWEISPADREEFIHVLSQACADLKWHGDRLVREEAG